MLMNGRMSYCLKQSFAAQPDTVWHPRWFCRASHQTRLSELVSSLWQPLLNAHAKQRVDHVPWVRTERIAVGGQSLSKDAIRSPGWVQSLYRVCSDSRCQLLKTFYLGHI